MVEDKIIGKLLSYAVNALGRDGFERLLDDMTPADVPAEIASFVGPVEAVFNTLHSVGPDRRTGWERWAATNWEGLGNDERVLVQAQSRSFVTICEIQTIIDDHRLVCADLLNPKDGCLVLFDREMAGLRFRFDRFLARICVLPNFARPIGMPISVEYRMADELIAAIEALLKKEKKGANAPVKTVSDWLSENLRDATEWLTDCAREQRDAILSRMDLHHCTATYEIVGTLSEVEAVFRKKTDFEPIEANATESFPKPLLAFLWLRRGESQALEKEMPAVFAHADPEREGWGILGNVRVYEDRIEIDTMHRRNLEFAKKMVPAFFGTLLQFKKEAVVDVAKIMRDQMKQREETDLSLWEINVVKFERDRCDTHLAELVRQTPGMREERLRTPGPCTHAFVWEPADELPVSIMVKESEMFCLCMSAEDARFVRAELPRVFGHAIRFVAEFVHEFDQPAIRGTEKMVEPEISEAPLTHEQRKVLLNAHESHYQKFMADRVPWLDNQTPREAARDSKLRPKLVDLMKFHINGLERRSRADGLLYTIDWVLDELGLKELK